MKKLKLKALELGASEVLTRAQLQHVLGGDGSSGGDNCIHCTGYEGACGAWSQVCYYRSNPTGDADEICRQIYSGCEDAYGWWGGCSGCIMN